MDTAGFADLDLSMSTAAKGSTDKLLWVLQSDSKKLVMFHWNNNDFSLFQFFFFLTLHTCLRIVIIVTLFFCMIG